MNDDFVLDGQNEETNSTVVSTMAANDALAESGVSSSSMFMSEQIKSMLSAPDFRHSNPFMSESEIQRRSGERWILPEDYEKAKGTEYKQEDTSSAWTTAKDSAKRLAMDLFMWGNKAQIGAGQLLAKATGNKIGWEMQQRAYDCLDSRMAEMERTYERPADLESFIGDATAGAMSMLEMYGASIATMGIAPLVQMGVDALGGGTYNNMRKYAKEHGGSIEGYEGNWLDIGIDLTNATAQVAWEKMGFGSKRWAKGLEKPLEKAGIKRWGIELLKRISEEVPLNALQEGGQSITGDLAEYLKGNEEAPNNWRGYGRAALLGGIGGGIFGAINTNARLKMDKNISDFVVATRLNKNPGANIAQVKKEADAFAKKFNDDVEDGLVKDTWDELSKRLDANNDRGVVRDNLVEQFTNARVAALGLESAEELDADDLADIQDAATVATGEAFRESFAFGVPIESTPTARLVAEGKDLTIRDLTPDEKGFAEKMPVDIEADRAKLAEQMAEGRDLAESRRVARERRAIEESAPTAETQAQLAELAAIREDERLPEIQTRAEEIKEQQQLLDENARLDEMYPAYEGETIDIDGTDRTVYNSTGERIAKSAEALRNFYKWFGDSKVVDEQGRPLVVYHGTNAKFDTFDTKRIGKQDYGFYGKGFYFTENKYVAEDYAKSSAFDEGEPIVMPVYLNLKKPFFMEYTNDNGISDEKHNRLVEQGYDGVIAIESRDLRKSGYEEELDKAKALNVEHLQLKDYEGNVVGRILPFEYVAWEPTQIKSVDNRGTFSADTGNIDFQQKLTDIAKGVVRDTGRGAYDPRYQRIILNKDSDISTILHELSHMWLNNYFKAYRNPKAPDVFKKMWKPVEKALNLREYDRYLDKRSSENFARSFEKWVMDGGKGASAEMTPVYERLSKRIADIYDGLATRYFDKVAELSPAVQNWFAKNEKIADSVMMQVPKKDKETGEETIEEKRVQYRDREKERKNAQKVAKTADKWEKVGAQLQSALDKIQPNLSESGKMREHDTSRAIRDRLSAKGILDGYKNMYETEETLEVAEKVRDYVTMNPDEAFEVAMGRKNAPGDLPATMVYTAVANKLDVDGDVAKLWELQQSPIVEYRSEIARELQRGRNFFQDGNGRPDIPRIVKYLNKAYENRMTETDKALLEKEVNSINDLIAKADLNFEDAWNKILSDIECK